MDRVKQVAHEQRIPIKLGTYVVLETASSKARDVFESLDIGTE